MIHSIHNEELTVKVNNIGSELWSIQSADGVESLWQGDPAYWSRRALTLFPYVARLTDKTYTMDGQEYHMPIHGFAPNAPFTLTEQEQDRLVLELTDSPETMEQYPRHFRFRTEYRLAENRLQITYTVTNTDPRTMYFGIGGHPGFNVPQNGEGTFEDWYLEFAEECSPVRILFAPSNLVSGQEEPFTLEEGRRLHLRHDLFDRDAIVFRDMCHTVTIKSDVSSRSVTMHFPRMPYLGVWHMPHKDAPYVCLEPWCCLPSREGPTTVIEEKPDILRLEPGQNYVNKWYIEINR